MSASLVGSGDVYKRQLHHRAQQHDLRSPALCCRPRPSCEEVDEPRNARAVSYTHLTLPTICSV
eukprot:12348109-Alexandrium_andersonii.AAC.1